MEHPFFSDQPLVKPESAGPDEFSSNKYFKKEYMDSFKEDVIKDIFTVLFRRAENESALKKFIPLKDIELVTDTPEQNENYTSKYEERVNEGGYHLLPKTISIDTALVKKETVSITRSSVLGVVLHEELHALTHQNIDGTIHMQVGLEEVFMDGSISSKSWTDFNEGMTEIIMDDLFEEYIRRTGDRKDFLVKGYEDGVIDSSYQAYFSERIFVNGIFMSVSNDLGLPLDVVREAFVQAYLSGMLQDDIRKELGNLSGVGVARRIESGAHVKMESKNRTQGAGRPVELSVEEKIKKEEEGRHIIKVMCSKYMKRSLMR
jgi:hypothetical protein